MYVQRDVRTEYTILSYPNAKCCTSISRTGSCKSIIWKLFLTSDASRHLFHLNCIESVSKLLLEVRETSGLIGMLCVLSSVVTHAISYFISN